MRIELTATLSHENVILAFLRNICVNLLNNTVKSLSLEIHQKHRKSFGRSTLTNGRFSLQSKPVYFSILETLFMPYAILLAFKYLAALRLFFVNSELRDSDAN